MLATQTTAIRRDSSTLPITRLDVAAYTIPTDEPESDGTLTWDSTTMVVAHVEAGDERGFGYTYAPAAAAAIIRDMLADAVLHRDAFDIEGCWQALLHAVRNAGTSGICLMAIAAVDIALWDLKAKLFNTSLVSLWGRTREAAPIYGSGGFTSYSRSKLEEQLGGWAENGIQRVKMKVGRDPEADPERVAAARRAIGERTELFVDANGGYSRKQGLRLANTFAEESDVVWFEEPRPSCDLAGLRLLRDHGPAGMDIAAGEYGDTPGYFRCMLAAGAVDCLQADATRCGGFTGFFKVAALCEAFHVPLSAHCAPQLHAHVGCCVAPLRHIEYFYDHVRIGEKLFDEHLTPLKGCLKPDPSRLGLGFALKQSDAEEYAVHF